MTPGPTSRQETTRLRRWTYRLLAPFWVVPALWCAGAVALGLLLPRVDQGVASWMPFLFQGGPDGARTVLSTVSGAMISVTGLVFSITIVVLQLASSQFSPRVLRTFLEDRVTQHTLGVFAASFLYSLTVLRSIVDTPGSTVPQLGVTMAYLLVLAAVAMFLAFIHHITESIAVGTVIRRTADETRRLLTSTGDTGPGPDGPATLPHLARQHAVTAPASGYLDTVDHAVLCAQARSHDVRIELLHALGSFVPEGSPLALVHGTDLGSTDWQTLVARGATTARERTMQQDLSFGLRRLVDIAERALSPGTNDPTTAVQVVDELHDLLRRLVQAPDRGPVLCDEDGVARLVTREATVADLLDLAVDEIAHYGADDVQVPRRLAAMLLDLEAAAIPAHRGTVAAKAASLS